MFGNQSKCPKCIGEEILQMHTYNSYSDYFTTRQEFLEHFYDVADRLCNDCIDDFSYNLENGDVLDLSTTDESLTREQVDVTYDCACNCKLSMFSRLNFGRCSKSFLAILEERLKAARQISVFSRSNLDLINQIMESHNYESLVGRVMNDPFICQVLFREDEDIAEFESNEILFSNLYACREFLNINKDYGYKHYDYEPFVCQGLFGFSSIQKLIEECLKAAKGAAVSLKEAIEKLVTRMVDSVSSHLRCISEHFDGIAHQLKVLMLRAIFGWCIPDFFIRVAFNSEQLHMILKAVAICISACFGVAGFFTGRLIGHVINYFTQASVDEVMKAQNLNFVYTIQLIGSEILGLSPEQMEPTLEKMKKICLILATGTIAKDACKMLFVMLPIALKEYLTYKFGSKETILRHRLRCWKASTLAILSASHIQIAYTNAEYFDMVSELTKQGHVLSDDLCQNPIPSIRSEFNIVFMKLVNLFGDLQQMKHDSYPRKQPFSVHLASGPGMGKSLLVKDMVRKFSGHSFHEIYTLGKESEFWDKYRDQPVIIMDEFLVGDQQKNATMVDLYLTLISNQTFSPNMASLDRPSVGVKGTTAHPDLVVTMNNTLYNRPVELLAKDVCAFQRRRNVVIQIVRSDKWRSRLDQPSNLDVDTYSDEELRDVVFANFRILPGEHVPDVTRYPLLSYHDMCSHVKDLYESWRERSSRLAGIFVPESEVDAPEAIDIISQLKSTVFDVPSPPSSFMEAIHEMFSPVMVAQGPWNDFERMSGMGVRFKDIMSSIVKTREDMFSKAHILFQGNPATSWLYDKPLWKIQATVKRNPLKSGVLIGSVMCALIYIKNLFSDKKEEVEVTYMAHSKPANKVSTKKKRVVKPKRGLKQNFETQGLPPVEVLNLQYAGNNFNVIPIKDRWILTFTHLFYSNGGVPPSEGDILSLEVGGEIYHCEYNDENLICFGDQDVCLYYFDNKQMNQFKDITRRFIKESDAPLGDNIQAMLMTQEGKYYFKAKEMHGLTYKMLDQQMICDDGFKYNAPTTSGDCGAPLILTTGPYANHICGIHIAGTDARNNPQGASILVTREMVQSASVMVAQSATTEVAKPSHRENFCAWIESAPDHRNEYTNLEDVEVLDPREALYLPTKTKLSPSPISRYLPWEVIKQPSILSPLDPRSKGQDPVRISLEENLRSECPYMSPSILKKVKSTMVKNLKNNLNFKEGQRRLTFEEACAGVPGVLNSINTKTSPGYPLVLTSSKPGKTDYVWFEGQDLKYDPIFKRMVEERVSEMESYNGEDIGNRFIQYLKDELRTHSKIDKCATRAIFANDLISLIAFRIVFGSILIAFQNSFPDIAATIGVNQYSHDMQVIYDRLSVMGNNFIAGDYSGFDKRMVSQAIDTVYEILRELLPESVANKNCWDYMYQHECKARIMVSNYLVRVKAMNVSGGFLTTILNCLVNEVYFRYIFIENRPYLPFDEHCKLVVLGDDHILSVSDKAVSKGINPKQIGEWMAEIGQKYTSAFKERELTDRCDEFDDILYLGAVPRILDGAWTGALRKETLEQTPHWTRDSGISTDEMIRCMIDCCSQWDKDYFEAYVTAIERAYKCAGRTMPSFPSYEELSTIQASRTASSGEDFGIWMAQSENNAQSSKSRTDNAVDFSERGLTIIKTSTAKDSIQDYAGTHQKLAGLSVNEQAMDLMYGLESKIKRTSISWDTTDSAGTNLLDIEIPWELLALGNANNIQNMPFSNFIYFVIETTLTFQLNGLPNQGGGLIAYFVPLSTATTFDQDSKTLYDHVFLIPSSNTTNQLTIPFKFWRSAMNTFAGGLSTESLGRLRVDVYSALTSQAASSCEVTLYSQFKGKFSIPRPLDVEEEAKSQIATGKKGQRLEPDADGLFVAQGNTSSTTYNISKVAGNVPIEHKDDMGVHLDAKVDGGLPFDNPPLAGGGIPIVQQFSSMSKSVGLEPTHQLQLHPEMMMREPHCYCDPKETDIGEILGKRGRIYTFTIDTGDAVGDELLTIPLNSIFGLLASDPTNTTQIPAHLNLLNLFSRWRADIVIEVCAFRSVYHSARVLATTAYGAPSISAGEENIFYNQPLDFNGDNYWETIRIPYNAATEFLRTFEGSGNVNLVQDYSLGLLRFSVLNPLKSTTQLSATSVSCSVFVRLENARVVQPRSNTMFSNHATFVAQSQVNEIAVTQKEVVSGVDIKVDSPTLADEVPSSAMVVTSSESNVQQAENCKLQIGRKYEYTVSNVCEPLRRYRKIALDTNGVNSVSITSGPKADSVTCIAVRPRSILNDFYAGWSGHMKYRIYFNYDTNDATAIRNPEVWYDSEPGIPGDLVSAPAQDGWLAYPGAAQPAPWDPAATNIVSSATLSNSMIAREYAYELSGNLKYIDVSIPFMSQYNYLPTKDNNIFDTAAQWSNGTLYIAASTGDLVVYEAVGDDFKYHVWNPSGAWRTKGYTHTSGSEDQTSLGIGGFRYTF